jgi:hypothetical protein
VTVCGQGIDETEASTLLEQIEDAHGESGSATRPAR